eukprot:1185091-Prorocentrum_minimum.AAC.2
MGQINGQSDFHEDKLLKYTCRNDTCRGSFVNNKLAGDRSLAGARRGRGGSVAQQRDASPDVLIASRIWLWIRHVMLFEHVPECGIEDPYMFYGRRINAFVSSHVGVLDGYGVRMCVRHSVPSRLFWECIGGIIGSSLGGGLLECCECAYSPWRCCLMSVSIMHS